MDACPVESALIGAKTFGEASPGKDAELSAGSADPPVLGRSEPRLPREDAELAVSVSQIRGRCLQISGAASANSAKRQTPGRAWLRSRSRTKYVFDGKELNECWQLAFQQASGDFCLDSFRTKSDFATTRLLTASVFLEVHICRGPQDIAVFNEIPESLRIVLHEELYRDFFREAHIFSGFQEPLFIRVMLCWFPEDATAAADCSSLAVFRKLRT